MIPFRTASGLQVDLERFGPSDVSIVDIACALSRVCRFAGHIHQFFSVAEHSLLVARLVDPPYQLPALLHDASEAYLGDVSRNLKHSSYMQGYRVIEARVQQAIEQCFGLVITPAAARHIKLADDAAAVIENTVLREGKDILTHTDLARLLGTGFVKSTAAEMFPMFTKVGILHLPPQTVREAEYQFITRFQNYAR